MYCDSILTKKTKSNIKPNNKSIAYPHKRESHKECGIIKDNYFNQATHISIILYLQPMIQPPNVWSIVATIQLVFLIMNKAISGFIYVLKES